MTPVVTIPTVNYVYTEYVTVGVNNCNNTCTGCLKKRRISDCCPKSTFLLRSMKGSPQKTSFFFNKIFYLNENFWDKYEPNSQNVQKMRMSNKFLIDVFNNLQLQNGGTT